MKAVRITELDEITEFPVGYIVKADGSDEMVGCCPKGFFNFFGLLDAIDELKIADIGRYALVDISVAEKIVLYRKLGKPITGLVPEPVAAPAN